VKSSLFSFRCHEATNIVFAFCGTASDSAPQPSSIPPRSSPLCADSVGTGKALIIPIESPSLVPGWTPGAEKVDYTSLHPANERCGEAMERMGAGDQGREETQFCAASGTKRITA